MTLNVGKELAALQRMTVDELRARYAEVFGEPTNGRHKDWLIKRIAWRMQALAEGDLSERARRRADGTGQRRRPADARPPESAKPAAETRDRGRRPRKLRTSGDSRLPLPGTHAHPRVQGRDARGEGAARRVRVRRRGLQVAHAPWPRRSPARTGTATTSSACAKNGGDR